MTILTAISRKEAGDGPLPLAAMLARSCGQDLLVVTVVPAVWPPGSARVDAEYRRYLRDLAQEILDRARDRLPADLTAEFHVQHSRSSGTGILDAAAQAGASMIVVGSAGAGAHGQIALGSVSDRLLHTSPLPLAVTPRGFRFHQATGRVRRVTVAYGGADTADEIVRTGAALARRLDAEVRLAAFAVRPHTAFTAGVGMRSEDAVVDEWVRELASSTQEVIGRARDAGAFHGPVEAVVGRGTTWSEALDDVRWEEGDLLLVGSSFSGGPARVFLGSRATKIMRYSPVPVLAAPRAR